MSDIHLNDRLAALDWGFARAREAAQTDDLPIRLPPPPLLKHHAQAFRRCPTVLYARRPLGFTSLTLPSGSLKTRWITSKALSIDPSS